MLLVSTLRRRAVIIRLACRNRRRHVVRNPILLILRHPIMRAIEAQS